MNAAVRYQVMPPLAPDEYQELHESIKAQGVLDPIHVDENGVVIDGHHRSKIANELGIPCPVITHDDLDEAGKRSLAFTLNLKRRHLNREQRRALKEESIRKDPQLSNRDHAKRLGTSHSEMRRVREDLEGRGEVDQRSTSKGSDGKSYPVSQPKREVILIPVSEWPDSVPAPVVETPFSPAPGLDSEDLSEINEGADSIHTPNQTQPQKPRPEPVTSRFTSAVNDLNRVLDKFHRISTDRNFKANKNQVATLHGNDLARAISELQNLADNLN